MMMTVRLVDWTLPDLAVGSYLGKGLVIAVERRSSALLPRGARRATVRGVASGEEA
jgi:hypothetical protein